MNQPRIHEPVHVSIPFRLRKNDAAKVDNMAEFKVVGRAVPRAEGADKVIGRTLYAADVALPGTLWGKILRSPYPHARILRIDTANARKFPGVKAIVTGEDTCGLYIGKQIRDMPVLCWDTVRFVCDR